MSKYITEILSELNDDPSSVVKYKDNAAIKILFDYAYNPEQKLELPEGIPPFKEDPAPIGMSPANLMMELKKLYVFKRTDISALRRETLFVQLLENVHPTEARLLLAVKDQDLTIVYKKLSHKFAFENGLVSIAPPEKVRKKPKATTGQMDSPEEEK